MDNLNTNNNLKVKKFLLYAFIFSLSSLIIYLLFFFLPIFSFKEFEEVEEVNHATNDFSFFKEISYVLKANIDEECEKYYLIRKMPIILLLIMFIGSGISFLYSLIMSLIFYFSKKKHLYKMLDKRKEKMLTIVFISIFSFIFLLFLIIITHYFINNIYTILYDYFIEDSKTLYEACFNSYALDYFLSFKLNFKGILVFILLILNIIFAIFFLNKKYLALKKGNVYE